MANKVFPYVNYRGTTAINFNNSVFNAIVNAYVSTNINQTTESVANNYAIIAMKFARMFVRVTANTLNSSCDVVLRKNGSDSSLIVTIPAGTTGDFTNNSASVDFSVGDLYNYNIRTTSSTSGSITITIVGFFPEHEERKIIVASSPHSSLFFSTANLTRYGNIASNEAFATTTSINKRRLPISATATLS